MNVAVLGANGFIGGRAVEMLHLQGGYSVRAIVRSYSSMARIARFDVPVALADACNFAALKQAFDGADVVIHAVTGDPRMIEATLEPAYHAAQACGVKRLIYLSSASVHGQAPVAGTTESTPLHTWHALPYNNAKVRAERQLQRLREHGNVEVVLLRPGIVLGPRSRWIYCVADDLLNDRAALIGTRCGILNSIYVDNVIHAITCALKAPAADVDGEAFLIGDAELVTWFDLYRVIAASMGISPDRIQVVDAPSFAPTLRDRLRGLHASNFVQKMLPLIPARTKRVVKAALHSMREPKSDAASGWKIATSQRGPDVTQEMALLHHCRWKFPNEKACLRLGYAPPVTFHDGCQRSIAWLKYVGYPVLHTNPVMRQSDRISSHSSASTSESLATVSRTASRSTSR